MKYLNDLEYSQSQSLYAGEPVQEIKALNQAMSNEYETTRKNKDALDSLAANLDVRDVDYGVKKQTIEGLRSQFEDLVKKGDYQNARFVVNDAIKKFNNDPLLKGAKNSKLAEVAYQKDLTDKLNSGKIDEETFLYKSKLSKEKNQTPVSFDAETGMTKGLYRGETAFEDKSKEIYDLFNERGKGWEPDAIRQMNGERYKKIGGVAGGYLNMETGETVRENDLFNAFKTELRGRQDFADYLDQEKEIDIYKFTGGSNIIDKNLLNKVMDDEEVKARLIGLTPSEFEKLKESKDPKDSKLLLEAKQKFENLDDKDIKNLYDSRYDQIQNSKYVSPSASKYSFERYKDVQWENKPYLMQLDNTYKKQQIKFKDDLENATSAPLPENKADIESITGDEFIKQQEYIKGIDTKLKDATISLELAQKTGNKAIIAQAEKTLNGLKHNKEAYNQNQASVITNLNPEGKKQVLNSLYNRVLNSNEFRNELIKANSGISIPIKTNLVLLQNLRKQLDADPTNMRLENEFMSKYNQTVDLLQKEKDPTLVSKALNANENKDIGLVKFKPTQAISGMGGGGATVTYGTKEDLNSIVAEAIDEQSLVNVGNNSTVYGLDYNTDKGWERGLIDRVTSLVSTNPTGFSRNGITLDQVYSGTSSFKFLNDEGDEVNPDASKTKIGFVTNNLNGDIQLKLTFADKNGRPLLRKTGEGKTVASMNFTPEDQSGISNSYLEMGTNLLKSGVNSNNKATTNQGLNILGYTQHGQELSLFRPTAMKVGETRNVTMDIDGVTRNLTFKVLNETVDKNKNFEVYEEGKKIVLPTLDLPQGKSQFGSKEEFFNAVATLEHYAR